MGAWKKILSQVLETVEKTVGVKIDPAIIDTPPDPAMGDIVIPCFTFAKEISKRPGEIADEWAERLSAGLSSASKGLIESADADGPYVNITLDSELVAKIVFDSLDSVSENSKDGRGKTVMIEYSQPNTHKEFHVGHLRNVSLGSALVELYRKKGYKVIAANYIGDIGAHVAKCLWALTNFHKDEKPPKGKEGAWLGKIYVEGHRKTSEDEQTKEESKEILRKLEEGDPELKKLWEKTKKWSMNQFNAIYKDLGVEFDEWYFESEVESAGKEVVEELIKKGIAKKSQGAIVVNLEKEDLGIFLILRSDGTALYSTKDLALAYKKFDKYELDESIYVIDNRQAQYFQQLFRTLELLGFDKKMTHAGYEFVTTPQGAMSSRTGNVIRYEDVRNEVEEKLKKETKKRHKNWSDKKITETAHSIMVAALKFMMLKSDPDKIITFDMDEALSFDGYTGPYVQYSYARIQSILRKIESSAPRSHWQTSLVNGERALLRKPEEKYLLLALSRFWKEVEDARLQYNPAILCRYLFEVSKRFTDFYSKYKIIGNEQETWRLALCQVTATVLENGLEILGIPVLEEM